MANPYFLKEFMSGRMEGWQRDNPYPGLEGHRNPYFQNVMNGAMQYGDEDWLDDEAEDKFVFYYNDEVEALPELMVNERFIIKQNWNALYNLISSQDEEEGIIDPTSLDGNYL